MSAGPEINQPEPTAPHRDIQGSGEFDSMALAHGLNQCINAFNELSPGDPILTSEENLMPVTAWVKKKAGIAILQPITSFPIGIRTLPDLVRTYHDQHSDVHSVPYKVLLSCVVENVLRLDGLNAIASKYHIGSFVQRTPPILACPLPRHTPLGLSVQKINEKATAFKRFYIGTEIRDASAVIDERVGRAIESEKRELVIHREGKQGYALLLTPKAASVYQKYVDVFGNVGIPISPDITLQYEPLTLPTDFPERVRVAQAVFHLLRRDRPDYAEQMQLLREFVNQDHQPIPNPAKPFRATNSYPVVRVPVPPVREQNVSPPPSTELAQTTAPPYQADTSGEPDQRSKRLEGAPEWMRRLWKKISNL
jgi:hypothetical protein